MAAARTAGILLIAAVLTTTAARPTFYPDDPLWVDDDRAFDASGATEVEDAGSYDFVVNTFSSPGERADVRAQNINTVDEVPDSSWFVNRIGRHPMPLAEIVRGPDRFESISLDGWVVSAGKSSGAQPGFRMLDPEGHTYQIEFDPVSNPEMATGAEVIGTAFYHAFGYHTVDVYLADLDPERLVISEKATIFDPLIGGRRRFTRADVDSVLAGAARQPNGRYRVLASRFADGAPLGNFRYYGTRPDDPNDIVPHEHRRELRAARVFGAWLNHDDSRGVNSLDMLVREGSRAYVKHYMFDFGSIMGSGTVHPQVHRAGNEYILEWKPGWLTLATLGLYTRPWMHIRYPNVPPSVGRFEGHAFRPELWKPEYPNPAFRNMQPDDAFWAARIVSRFPDEAIRAVVNKGRYSDPQATEHIVATLIARRDKVVRHWLTQVTPLVEFTLDDAGELTFDNAAEQAGVATAPSGYRLEWARFDNATGEATRVGDSAVVSERRARAPQELISQSRVNDFVQVLVAAEHAQFPGWSRPVTVHFRRSARGWDLAGVTRVAD